MLDLQHAIARDVDDLGCADALRLGPEAVSLMGVSVYQVLRLIAIDERPECPEPLMGEVIRVVDACRRRMSD